MRTRSPSTAQPARSVPVAKKAKPDTVSALDRGLAVLECFRPDQRALNSTEISRLTGIPRPTVVRLAATLVQHGWLNTAANTEHYHLGAAAVTMARTFLAGLDVRAVARAPMQALADAHGASVFLARRDGLEMVIIEACRAQNSMFSTRLDVGSRIPLPNSALGRAYLATLPQVERGGLVDSLRMAQGRDWAVYEPGLQAALAEHARSGYCLCAGEFHTEINSLSVALTGPQGEVWSFNCGGPAFQFSPQRLRSQVGPALKALALGVAERIGGKLGGVGADASRTEGL